MGLLVSRDRGGRYFTSGILKGGKGAKSAHPREVEMPESMSAYLQNEQRLADVIAVIQAMASNEYYEKRSEKWAGIISGDEQKGDYWRTVFGGASRVFRFSQRGAGENRKRYYSLIARRALPHFDKGTGKVVYYAEHQRLTNDMLSEDKRERFGRPQLPDSQIKVLVDVAINLHTKAKEADRDWRWWFAPAAAFFASLLTAMFAFVAAWQFR